MTVLALDVGGTKIAAAVIDDHGDVLRHATRPTPCHDPDLAWQAVKEAAEEATDGQELDGVGVACAGPVDTKAGTVSPINVGCWRDFPLITRLKQAFPDVRVELAGDGICMALGEHWLGGGR